MSTFSLHDYNAAAFFGLGIVGTALHPELPGYGTTIAAILTGQHDRALHCASHITLKKPTPSSFEEVENDPAVIGHVENIKNYLRRLVQGIFDAAMSEERHRMDAQRNALLAKLKTTNKPHVLGTVAEIAEKYGLSKSEVRRLKAQGTLEDFIAKKGNPV